MDYKRSLCMDGFLPENIDKKHCVIKRSTEQNGTVHIILRKL